MLIYYSIYLMPALEEKLDLSVNQLKKSFKPNWYNAPRFTGWQLTFVEIPLSN
jgi:hypothetical protein